MHNSLCVMCLPFYQVNSIAQNFLCFCCSRATFYDETNIISSQHRGKHLKCIGNASPNEQTYAHKAKDKAAAAAVE